MVRRSAEMNVQTDAELIASELALHLSRGAEKYGDSQHALDLDTKAAISETVEQIIGRELDKVSRKAAVGCDTRKAAEDLCQTSPMYAVIQEAVQDCAVQMNSQESLVGRQKKQRSAVGQSEGESGGASGGGTKSFSLFDMLDRQPLHVERVCADKILERYTQGIESGSVDWDGVASLLEDVEDIEDLIADPFSGSLWEEVNKLLGNGLAQPSTKVSTRYAEIHSKLASLCEQNPFETSQQLCDLTLSVLDSLLQLPPDSRTIGIAGEAVIVPELMLSLVQSFRSMVSRLVTVLDCLMRDDLRMLLKKIMLLVARKVEGTDPSHVLTVMALADPYADFFTMLLRELPAMHVVGSVKEAGVVEALISRCHSCGAITGIRSIEGGNSHVGTTCSYADLQHTFYVQSLSMLQRVLDMSDGSPDLFQSSAISNYSTNNSNDGMHGDGNLLRSAKTVLLPYQRTLLIGVRKGEHCVDQDLARVCGAAIETIILGQAQNNCIFVELFSSFVHNLANAVMEVGSNDFSPSSIEFLSVCRDVLVYSRLPDTTTTDGTSDSFAHSARLLGTLVDTLIESPTLESSDGIDLSVLRGIRAALDPWLGVKLS